MGEVRGNLLDLGGAEFDLGVRHFEGELVDAGFDGVPTGIESLVGEWGRLLERLTLWVLMRSEHLKEG